MLLVVRTEAAIVGATMFGAALVLQWQGARLDEVLAEPEIGGIPPVQGLLPGMERTAVQMKDVVALDHDLGRREAQTGLAERGCLSEEAIAPGRPDECVHGSLSS